MNRRIRRFGVLLMIVALLAGCGQELANVGSLETPTPLPPTATPIPPTATPAPPTATPAPPTATTVPPTATPVPLTPAPSRAPITPTTAPTVRPAITPTTAAQRPRGTVPAGWRIYNGTKLPFVMAYPPDWRVDDTKVGQVIFSAPSGNAIMTIEARSQRTTQTTDELRDTFARVAVQACVRSGTEATTQETISGISFGELVQTCDIPGQPLLAILVGAGLNNGYPWSFTAIGTYQNFNRTICKCTTSNVDTFFSPMLTTLNIYGNP